MSSSFLFGLCEPSTSAGRHFFNLLNMQASHANLTCRCSAMQLDTFSRFAFSSFMSKIGAKNLETGAWSALQMLLSAAQDITNFEQRSKVSNRTYVTGTLPKTFTSKLILIIYD